MGAAGTTLLRAGARARAALRRSAGAVRRVRDALAAAPPAAAPTTSAGATADGLTLHLDFPIHPRPRWGHGLPPHPRLLAIIDEGRERYASTLQGFAALGDDISRIPIRRSDVAGEPCWHNAWFFGLDGVAMYGMLAASDPALLVEVGSGNSTMFARRAIREKGLRTRIVSVDPQPRADIDTLCDEVIRCGLEDADSAALAARLQPGDVLSLDGSHLCLMNTDTVVLLLEMLPALPPGVLVHVHDVFLPWDYRPDWTERPYGEQYLVAAMLLAGGAHLRVELPAFFCSQDATLAAILEPLWERIGLNGYERAGHSFWMRTA